MGWITSSSEQSETYQQIMNITYYCVFMIPIYISISISLGEYYYHCMRKPHPMTIIFDNDINIIIYALERLSALCWEIHYCYAAQCIWWISALAGLQNCLVDYIEIQQSQLSVHQWDMFPTPRDIQKKSFSPKPLREKQTIRNGTSSAVDKHIKDYRMDPLRWTRKRSSNPLHKLKCQLKKESTRLRNLEQWKSAMRIEYRAMENI